MNRYLFYNHYEIVSGGYNWEEFKANNRLAECRTAEESDRDGQCKGCLFQSQPHFTVEESDGVHVLLCTVDIIRLRPFEFSMSMFGADRKHEQLKLFEGNFRYE